jgi:hypothetical protein
VLFVVKEERFNKSTRKSAVNNIFTVAEQRTDKASLNKGMSEGSRPVIVSTYCINEAILRPVMIKIMLVKNSLQSHT